MTATEDPHAPAAQHDLHLPPGVEAIDPEHDINAKTTVIWLSSCLVFVIVCIWVLSQVFAFNLADQRMVKIDLAPAEELRQIGATDLTIAVDVRSLEDSGVHHRSKIGIDADVDRIDAAWQ